MIILTVIFMLYEFFKLIFYYLYKHIKSKYYNILKYFDFIYLFYLIIGLSYYQPKDYFFGILMLSFFDKYSNKWVIIDSICSFILLYLIIINLK